MVKKSSAGLSIRCVRYAGEAIGGEHMEKRQWVQRHCMPMVSGLASIWLQGKNVSSACKDHGNIWAIWGFYSSSEQFVGSQVWSLRQPLSMPCCIARCAQGCSGCAAIFLASLLVAFCAANSNIILYQAVLDGANLINFFDNCWNSCWLLSAIYKILPSSSWWYFPSNGYSVGPSVVQ